MKDRADSLSTRCHSAIVREVRSLGSIGVFLRNGGQILERRVLDIEFNPDGARTLITDAGPMPVETLVVAAGAWSHRLASKLGHKVPLETQRGYHALLADPNMAPRRNVQWSERKFIATPVTSSAIRRPVVEAQVSPIWPWPKAK